MIHDSESDQSIANRVASRFRPSPAFNRLADRIAHTASFDAALEVLLRSICEETTFVMAQAWTRRMRDAVLECMPIWHSTTPSRFDSFRQATLARAFERGHGLPGLVWESGGHRWVNDVRLEPAFKRMEEARAVGLATGLFVPLIASGQVIAVLEFFSTTAEEEAPALVEMIHALGKSVASHLEQKRVDEESRVLYAALEQMSESVVITTAEPEPRIVFATQAFTRIAGTPRSEVIGARLFDVARPVADVGAIELLRRALVEKRSFFGELLTARSDGSQIPCEWSLSSVTNVEGDVQSFVIVQRDVSALNREQVQRARLAESVRKAVVEWQRTFDAIETPIWIVDLEGVVVRLNRHAQNLSGRTYSDTIGLPLASLGTGEPWSTAIDLVRRVAESRAPVSVQVRDESTTQTWDMTASVVNGAAAPSGFPEIPARVLVVARDITRVVTLQESLRRSETMATMGAIVAGVAHEVRNPLFGISATIDALELRLDDESTYRDYTNVLRTEVSRLTKLMSELLEYGRPARVDLRPGRIRPVLEEAIRATAALAREREVFVSCELGAEPPAVAIDGERLTQVFSNLIENAIQHSGRGQKVILTAYVDRADDALVCTVRDFGVGFREEDIPHLFEPFFTRRRGGTGLGLSLVWRIVEEHSGSVSASPAPGGGARLVVKLPLSKREGHVIP